MQFSPNILADGENRNNSDEVEIMDKPDMCVGRINNEYSPDYVLTYRFPEERSAGILIWTLPFRPRNRVDTFNGTDTCLPRRKVNRARRNLTASYGFFRQIPAQFVRQLFRNNTSPRGSRFVLRAR